MIRSSLRSDYDVYTMVYIMSKWLISKLGWLKAEYYKLKEDVKQPHWKDMLSEISRDKQDGQIILV